ncbi:MAG: hypothetical protein SOV27_04295, partial [Eubacteriales bacterium]|nr:hypothetical protein [Eubacteriales bacterium]
KNFKTDFVNFKQKLKAYLNAKKNKTNPQSNKAQITQLEENITTNNDINPSNKLSYVNNNNNDTNLESIKN